MIIGGNETGDSDQMSRIPSHPKHDESAPAQIKCDQDIASHPHVTEPQVPYVIDSDLRVQEHQLRLFDFGPNDDADGEPFRDPAFVDNKSLPVHRWTPWIAGFSAPFVDGVFDTYLNGSKKRTPRILDPFAGVGTTLVQSVLRGYDAIGFEINPYATLAARTKTKASVLNLQQLDDMCREMASQAEKWRSTDPPANVCLPPMKTRIPFFSEAVEKQALHALAFIRSIPDEEIANIFRLAFGAVMVGVSNYTYEPSLGSRPAAGKPLIEDADVYQTLSRKLSEIRSDIEWLQNGNTRRARIGEAQVYNQDFFSGYGELDTGSIDLMVTSPPYMNNYHYVRNTRPQLYWLDFISSPIDQKYLETGNFGKYWQTVRDKDTIPLDFSDPDIEHRLQRLREIRAEKGAYGGPGWANYVTAYLNDCHKFLTHLRRLLRRRGVGVIVIGNSIIQGMEFRVDEVLGNLAESVGFQSGGIHVLRKKRVGASITSSSVRRGAASKATLYESAVVVRKR